MGCPDWPKCFGMLVPPTDVSQLPANYKELFKKPGYEVADFDVVHTYTEYVNRLIGATFGLVVLINLGIAFKNRKTIKGMIGPATAALVLTLLEGWLGAKVVDTHLKVWVVTIHMLMALLIVMTLMMQWVRLREVTWSTHDSSWRVGFLILTLLTVIQVLLGTQVREAIDEVQFRLSGTLRETWIDEAGTPFLIHRSFTYGVVLTTIWLHWRLKKNQPDSPLLKGLMWLEATFIIQLITGVAMAYAGVPAEAQAIHLFIGTLSVGILSYLLGMLYVTSRMVKTA